MKPRIVRRYTFRLDMYRWHLILPEKNWIGYDSWARAMEALHRYYRDLDTQQDDEKSEQ